MLQDIGGDSVLAYRWINATAITDANSAPSPVSAGSTRARRVGGILGRIHALPLHFVELQPPEPFEFDNSTPFSSPLEVDAIEMAEWALLVKESERRRIPRAQKARALLPQIAEWVLLSREAQHALLTTNGSRRAWIISHADLDQKNVIWDRGANALPH